MRTIVGDSTKKTKDNRTGKIVKLDANLQAVPTNVSQYGAGGIDIKELETAKHFASEAEKSANSAASSANRAENYYDLTVEAALEVQNNTDDSFNYLEEIKKISVKIDGQEAGIDESEKQVILHATAAENAAKIASDSAIGARASEANAAASASSANNSAVSSKESEQIAIASKDYAIAAATKGHQILAQTEAVYDKTIDDVSQAVQSYLKDKGGFDPAAGLPIPDSWFDIFGVEKKLSCLWVADKAGTIPTTGVGFNEGDILIYNSLVDRYGRFSGELVTGGGGGGATEFFNDIKLAADKRLLGTDSRGSAVELIKLTKDIVEAGDKTKVMHLLAKDVNSAFVCIANAASGFDNYEIYHEGNKPSASDVGAYHKAEADAKFVDVTGDTMSGDLSTTATIKIKSKEVYHPGNRPPASDLDAVSLTKSEVITGRKSFTQNPIIENTTPTLSLKEGDTDTEVLIKVESKVLSVGTTIAKPLEVDVANNTTLLANPKSKTGQGTTPDALTRKDYVEAELAKKLDKTGNPTISSDLIITGKITVEGTGSIFKDINTTGQLRENSVRVYSPANKPSAIDVGALPISGGSVGGALNAVGNLSSDGFIIEKGQRVYSPNNRPTPEALGVYSKEDSNKAFVTKAGDSTIDGTLTVTTQIKEGSVRVYSPNNKPTAADIGAIGVDNVYTKIESDGRFWQRTETVNRAFSSNMLNSFSGNADTFKNDSNFRTYISGTSTSGYPSVYGSGFYQGRMSGVNHQGWSLYNEASSNNLYHGRQLGDGSGFTWYKIYHEGFKPTAADVKALPITGGVMVGAMTMADNSRLDGHNHVNRHSTTKSSYTHYYDDLTSGMTEHNLRFAKGDGNLTAYNFNGSGAIHSDTEGRFYSQGFKPTAVDVGALPLSGGTMLGIIKNETTHGTILSGGVGFSDLLGINDKAGAGGAYFGKDGYWFRTGNAANQPKIIRNNTEYEIYHQGNKPTASDVGAYSVSDFIVETGAAADTVVRRTGSGGIHNNGLTSPGNVRVNLNPAGTRISGGSSETGAIKITLPTTGSECMLKIYVSVYNYASDTSFDAVLSGYDSSPNDANIWYETSAVITGSASTPNHPVYFGKEGDKSCIWIGSVGQGWVYPQVTITKVESGYNGGNKELWTAGWHLSLVTSLGTITRTISDALIKPGGANIVADEQPTANTLVRRNASGNIAAKGRVLIASNNDSDVGAGTAYVDFVSSAGNSYGSVGDVDGYLDIRLTSNQGYAVTNGAEGSTLQHAGNSVLIARTSGIEISAKTTITVPNNTPSLFLHNGGGWSYMELKSGANQSHIALNDKAIDGGIAGSLHLRPAGTQYGSLILQPNSLMIHQSPTGWVGIGSANASYVHFQTDRPKYHFDKEVQVQGEIMAGANYNMRVYHQGFKPTPDEIGALPIGGGQMTGNLHANGGGGFFPAANNNGAVGNSGWRFNEGWFNSINGTTVRAERMVRGFGTSNVFGGAGLETGATTTDPSISFHKEGAYAATLRLIANGSFAFVNQDNSAYADLTIRSMSIQGSINSNLNVNANISVNQTDGTGLGVSLYGNATTDPEYGLMFAKTATFGTHGGVVGDWATYFNMTGASNRGWIFRNKGVGMAASLSSTGYLTLNNIRTGDATSTSWWRTEGDGGWYSATHGGGFHMTNPTWVEVYGGKKFYVANTEFDSIQVGGGIYLGGGSINNIGHGVTGVYAADKFQGVFAMGHQYRLPQNGVGGGTLYGIAWTHSNNPSAEARKLSGHHMCVMENGATYVAAGTSGIWSRGVITTTSYVNADSAGGSWGHGNTPSFATNNATSTGSAYNLIGAHGGARIQCLGGTGGEFRIYPNNGSSQYLSISSTQVTTTGVFNGNGGNLHNIPAASVRRDRVVVFNSATKTNNVALPSAVVNHLNAGGFVDYIIVLRNDGDKQKTIAGVVAGGGIWTSAKYYEELTWMNNTNMYWKNSHSGWGTGANKLECQYSWITYFDYRLL